MKTVTLALAVLLSTAAVAAEPLKKSDGVLVDAAGMTVYTFDKDVANSGKSACLDAVSRDDGSKQLAYKGKPLYLFAGDKKAGDRNGDNVKDIWHVVKD
jgi:predicted lipoprotein with Yx(FWY)xxD motif